MLSEQTNDFRLSQLAIDVADEDLHVLDKMSGRDSRFGAQGEQGIKNC